MRHAGFTLIELMIVVAIVGVLAAIATPKFSNLITKSRDATTKGNLGALRSALSIYNADTEGWFPAFAPPYNTPAGYNTILQDALVPKYMSSIPAAYAGGGAHPYTNEVLHVWNHAPPSPDEWEPEARGWQYDANPLDNMKPAGYRNLWGTIRVACDHNDAKGVNWSTY